MISVCQHSKPEENKQIGKENYNRRNPIKYFAFAMLDALVQNETNNRSKQRKKNVDESEFVNLVNQTIGSVIGNAIVYILFTLVASVICLILHKRSKHREREIFNGISAVVIFLSYLFILFWFGMLANGNHISPFS